MDVAIDCIADAFEVNKEDDSKTLKDVFHGKSLSELLKSSVSFSSTSEKSESVPAAKEVDADKLKLMN